MKKYNITAICALASSLLIGSSCLAMNNQPYYHISPPGSSCLAMNNQPYYHISPLDSSCLAMNNQPSYHISPLGSSCLAMNNQPSYRIFPLGSSCLAMNNQPSYRIFPLVNDLKIILIQNGIDKDDYFLVRQVISNHVVYGTDGKLYYVYNQLSSTFLIYKDYRELRNQALSHILDEKTRLNNDSSEILRELTMREVTSILQIGSLKKVVIGSLVNEVYKGIQSCQSQDKVINVLSTILASFPNPGDRMIFVQNLLLNKAKTNNDQKTIENLFFALEYNIMNVVILSNIPPRGTDSVNDYKDKVSNFIDYKKPWFQEIVEAYVNSTLKFFHPDRPYMFLNNYARSILNNNLNQFLIDTISTNSASALFLIEKPIPANILCWAIDNFKNNYAPNKKGIDDFYITTSTEILKSCVSCVEITSMEEVFYISKYLTTMTNPKTYIKALQIIYKNNLKLYIKLCCLWKLHRK